MDPRHIYYETWTCESDRGCLTRYYTVEGARYRVTVHIGTTTTPVSSHSRVLGIFCKLGPTGWFEVLQGQPDELPAPPDLAKWHQRALTCADTVFDKGMGYLDPLWSVLPIPPQRLTP